MAMYHFRIKSDKRTNGSVVNAVSHAKYINREDEYINIDSKQELANQKFSGNTISGSNTAPDANGMELLYKSPLGSIVGEHGAICISDNPSVATVDIGLMYAYKQNDGPLHITGTNEFKAQVILCAADMNLDIKFDDPEMQDIFENLKQEYNTPMKGENNAARKTKSKSEIPDFRESFAELLDDNDEIFRGGTGIDSDEYEESADELFAPIKNMQDSDVDYQGDESKILQSSEAEENDIDNLKEGLIVLEEKRNISITRINRAEKISMDIIMASNGMTKGADHVAYINREEAFASRGGCVYTANHLPSWAKDAKDFFAEADKNERINGSRYKEIEFALPNELDLEQQKEIKLYPLSRTFFILGTWDCVFVSLVNPYFFQWIISSRYILIIFAGRKLL